MSNPQIITQDGKPAFAVLPIAEYERLQESAEQLADIRAFDEAIAESAEAFPDWVAQRLVDGEHPIRVFRAYRRLTLTELAGRTGLSTSYISKIESNKGGSVHAFQAIARALDLSVDDLIE